MNLSDLEPGQKFTWGDCNFTFLRVCHGLRVYGPGDRIMKYVYYNNKDHFVYASNHNLSVELIKKPTREEKKQDKMTPYEKAGYKPGDIFEVIDDEDQGYISIGDVLIFDFDDNTNLPRFKFIKSEYLDTGDETYCDLSRLKRIYPEPEPKPKPKTVTIECEGETKVISRESAIALNLIKE